MDPRFDPLAMADPTMRQMVAVSRTEYDGSSGDGTVRAVVRGDLTVVRVVLQPTVSAPGVVGQRVAEAINGALRSARAGARAGFLAIPGLSPALREALSGDSGMPVEELGTDTHPDPALLDRDFSGSDGGVLVTVAGLSQEVASVQLPDLSEEVLGQVPRATNRALAAAQTGRDGAPPLNEQVEDALETLDEKISALESRLDGVEDSLDAVARDLGL